MKPSESVTQLLAELRGGDESAAERLFPVVYEELRGLAGHVQRDRQHTLQPTALVHEAYMRLAGQAGDWSDRRHFFNVAALAMRQILIDHARRRRARKRDGVRERLSFQNNLADREEETEFDLLDFEDALQALEKVDPRQARVVSLRFLAGLSIEDVAAALEVSPRTVNVDWQMARAWLRRAMLSEDHDQPT